MSITAACLFAAISAILALALRRHNPELSALLAICACCLLLAFSLGEAYSAYSEIQKIMSECNIDPELFKTVFKALGICFITEFAYDCCIDSGQQALGGNALLAGKICVLVTALPLFRSVLDISLGLINSGV